MVFLHPTNWVFVILKVYYRHISEMNCMDFALGSFGFCLSVGYYLIRCRKAQQISPLSPACFTSVLPVEYWSCLTNYCASIKMWHIQEYTSTITSPTLVSTLAVPGWVILFWDWMEALLLTREWNTIEFFQFLIEIAVIRKKYCGYYWRSLPIF